MGRATAALAFVVLVALGWWVVFSGVPAASVAPPVLVGGYGSTLGSFIKPRAIAIAATGDFYVVDRSGRIQHFDAEGQVLGGWETPEHAKGQPVGLDVETDGSLLVSDSHYSRVLRYAAGGSELLDSFGSRGTGPGELTWGRDVVVDSQGFVYVGDYGGENDRILKFTHAGDFVLAFGSMGEAPGQFLRPQGMTIEVRDGQELLLVADCSNHRVQRFTLDGDLLGAVGRMGRGEGEFRYPMAVAVAGDGALYVCEWGNNRIQKLTPAGEHLGFWGGPGGGAGQLSTPWDIEIGPDGRLFVADYGNHRVQIFRWVDGAESGPAPAWQGQGGEPAGGPPGAVDAADRERRGREASAILSGRASEREEAP